MGLVVGLVFPDLSSRRGRSSAAYGAAAWMGGRCRVRGGSGVVAWVGGVHTLAPTLARWTAWGVGGSGGDEFGPG